MEPTDSPWSVSASTKVAKQIQKLPKTILPAYYLLFVNLQEQGPEQTGWHHYGKLKGKGADLHHCHLNKGKPRYVAVWEVVDLEIKLIEVRYVGTHENAPY
jgi:mRNA-degrading endonuclease RelE of RelBE toxin-antitoxin system